MSIDNSTDKHSVQRANTQSGSGNNVGPEERALYEQKIKTIEEGKKFQEDVMKEEIKFKQAYQELINSPLELPTDSDLDGAKNEIAKAWKKRDIRKETLTVFQTVAYFFRTLFVDTNEAQKIMLQYQQQNYFNKPHLPVVVPDVLAERYHYAMKQKARENDIHELEEKYKEFLQQKKAHEQEQQARINEQNVFAEQIEREKKEKRIQQELKSSEEVQEKVDKKMRELNNRLGVSNLLNLTSLSGGSLNLFT